MTQFKSERDQELEKFLRGRYESSKAYQESEGRVFDISWDEYLVLWKRKRYFYNTLRQKMLFGDPMAFMLSDKGYVLSWKNKNAFMDGICSIHTMEIKTKEMSKRVCHMQSGDTHSQKSKDKIRDARTGTKHSRDTKMAISASLTGVPKSSQARKNMSDAANRRWAKHREEKAAAIAATLFSNADQSDIAITI